MAARPHLSGSAHAENAGRAAWLDRDDPGFGGLVAADGFEPLEDLGDAELHVPVLSGPHDGDERGVVAHVPAVAGKVATKQKKPERERRRRKTTRPRSRDRRLRVVEVVSEESMTLLVRKGVHAFVLGVVLSACAVSNKPDFEAGAERLKAYIVSEAPKETIKLDADFDGAVRLIGYELSPQARQARSARDAHAVLAVVEARGARLPAVHARASTARGAHQTLDDEGPLRGPAKGVRASAQAWQAGKVYIDELRFKVPKGVKAEKIDVVAGVANRISG